MSSTVFFGDEKAADGSTPFHDRVRSKSGFDKAIRDEKRKTLRHLGWSEATHKNNGVNHDIFFRDGLEVLQQFFGDASGIWLSKDDMFIFEENWDESGGADSGGGDAAHLPASAKWYGPHDPAHRGLMDG